MPTSEALGRTLDELSGLPNLAPMVDLLRAARDGEQMQTSEHRFRRPDESTAVLEIKRTRLEGNAVVALIARDISARHEAEEALRKSEQRFQFLNDLGEQTREISDPRLIMAMVTRLLGQHLQVSRCAYADVESDSDRFTIQQDYTDGCASTVGDYHLSLFGPRAVADLLAGQTLVIRERRCGALAGRRRRDVQRHRHQGDRHLSAGEGRKAARHDGRAPGDAARLGALGDRARAGVVERCWAIIERARADAVLRVSETLKSAILDTSLDGFILMNHEGWILDWNNASERIFGLKREDAIGRMLGETILPARLREEHWRDLARYASAARRSPPGRSLRAPGGAQ